MSMRRSNVSAPLVLFLGLQLAATAILADTIRIEPIAVQFQQAPGGGTYIVFGDIAIDDRGRVLYTASLSNGRVALFKADARGVEPLVSSGDPAPAEIGGVFQLISQIAGNAEGQVAFSASTLGPSRTGLFLLEDGVISVLALAGDPLPLETGEVIAAFDQIQIQEDGEVYFLASLAGGDPDRRGVFLATASGVDPVIVPAQRYGRTRAVYSTLQYDVNDRGEVAALARITDASTQSLVPDLVSEIILLSGGELETLASASLTLSGGIEQVRFFAITFDQVKLDDAGTTVFFASTTENFFGGYVANSTGMFLANDHVISEGDPAPLTPDDRFIEFGGFGVSSGGGMAFHATTEEEPRGGFFFRSEDGIQPVALVGRLRPDGLDVWHGFLKAKMNESSSFVFTDFFGLLQVGVFSGRSLGSAAEILAELVTLIEDSPFHPGKRALLARLRSVEMALDGGDDDALVSIGAVLVWLDRVGFDLPEPILDAVLQALDDLRFLLVSEGASQG